MKIYLLTIYPFILLVTFICVTKYNHIITIFAPMKIPRVNSNKVTFNSGGEVNLEFKDNHIHYTSSGEVEDKTHDEMVPITRITDQDVHFIKSFISSFGIEYVYEEDRYAVFLTAGNDILSIFCPSKKHAKELHSQIRDWYFNNSTEL